MKKTNFTIAANWKMNPETLSEAKKLYGAYKSLAKKHSKLNFVCAVPAIYLSDLGGKTRAGNLYLCAQNVYYQDSGSYTGATSIPMVKDAGADMVMIGHSERRNIFGVSDDIITKKIAHAIKHKIPMVVCFGESDRDEDGKYTEELEAQLQAICEPFVKTKKTILLSLAYEPVWAIGSGAKRAVTEDELFSTLLLIKNILGKYLGKKSGSIPIWYGGSVNPDNSTSLAKVPHVQGFLIGRASLDGEKIKNITKSV